MPDTEYLHFDLPLMIDGRKTKVVNVWSVRGGDLLASIKWFGPWRQYALFPEPGTIWNPACLDAVNDRIRALMNERRPTVRRTG